MKNNLVFLCGFPSSGTELLKTIVNAHSDVFIGEEYPFLPNLARKYKAIVSAEMVEQLITDLKKIDVYNHFLNAQLPNLRENSKYSIEEIYSKLLSEDSVQWKGNKTPQYTENIAKIRELFPRAKFILIVRDVRDVTISWQKKWGKDKLLCASKWNHRMQLGYSSLHNLDDNDFLIIKYEEILDDLEEVGRIVCKFLNIEYQEKMLEFYRYVAETDLDGKINYGKALIKENKEKWREKMSQEEIKRIEEIAFDALNLFQYTITTANKQKKIYYTEKLLGTLKDVFALIFIGNRAIKNNQLQYRINAIMILIKKRIKILQN